MRTIVLITPGQPTTDPRLVKEASALAECGYRVVVLYNFWVSWAREYDEEIKSNYPNIEWIETGGNPFTSASIYLFTRLRHKIYRMLHRLFPKNLHLAIRAEIRGFDALLKRTEKIKADLYVAHNLGALPVAAITGRKHKSLFAFDAEDFHRGQVVEHSKDYNRIKLIEDHFLINAGYITAASPQIAQAYETFYQRKITTINNVFSKSTYPQEQKHSSKKIKLFWFSQTIGKGRGLEDVFAALKLLATENFSLTLLGYVSCEMREYFERLLTLDNGSKIDVTFLHPIHPDKIKEVAMRHDIGLALEPGRDQNNQLALSNKIFLYLLAGNAIVFSSTVAQRQFFEENPGVGSIYTTGNVNMLVSVFRKYIEDSELLRSQRMEASRIAKEKYNWGSEQIKFLSVVQSILN